MTAMPPIKLVDPNPSAPLTDGTLPSVPWWDRAQPAYDDAGKPNWLDERGGLVAGIYFDMPNEVYHALDAHSSTGFKKFAKSGKHYERAYIDEVEKTLTKAQERTFDTGSVGHALVLEPHNVTSQFVRKLDPDDLVDPAVSTDELVEHARSLGLEPGTSRGEVVAALRRHDPKLPILADLKDPLLTAEDLKAKAKALGLAVSGTKDVLTARLLAANPDLQIMDVLLAEQAKLAEQDGRKVVDGKAYDNALRLRDTVFDEPRARALIDHSNGFPEVSFIGRCPLTGMWLKCRFDWLGKDYIATDLKTCASAELRKVVYQMKDLRYDIQQVHYTYVAKLLNVPLQHFAFVYVEYDQADICEVYDIHPSRIRQTTEEYMGLLPRFSRCIKSGEFDGYHPKGSVTTLIW